MNKKLVIINQNSGYLMIDIANAFAVAGHEVTLITGRLVQRNTPLHPSIELQRVLRYNRNSIPARLFTWFGAFFQMLFLIWFRHRKALLFIVSNPPIAPLLPLFCRNPFTLLIYDVYIEKPEEFLLLKQRSPIAWVWRNLHTRVFKKANKIFTLTEGMKQSLEKYSSGNKVEVVPIWTDNNFFKPVNPVENPFIISHELQGKFIVMYSGNIGFSGETEVLVDLAKETNDPEVLFLFVGEGGKKQLIADRIKHEAIKNCMVLPWQDTSMLPFSLSSASIAVVTLGQNNYNVSIPSKTFNFLSVGAPVLSIGSPDSDLAILVNSNGVGKNFQTTQIKDMKNFILSLKNQPKEYERMKNNALKLAKKFSPKNAERFLS